MAPPPRASSPPWSPPRQGRGSTEGPAHVPDLIEGGPHRLFVVGTTGGSRAVAGGKEETFGVHCRSSP